MTIDIVIIFLAGLQRGGVLWIIARWLPRRNSWGAATRSGRPGPPGSRSSRGEPATPKADDQLRQQLDQGESEITGLRKASTASASWPWRPSPARRVRPNLERSGRSSN